MLRSGKLPRCGVMGLTTSCPAALVLGYITHRVGHSPIVGYLLAGVIVAPHSLEVALAFTEALLERRGATPEQLDRERDRLHRDLFGEAGGSPPQPVVALYS